MDEDTPGPLQRFERDDHGVDLFFARARLRLEVVAAGIVRVRATAAPAFAPRRSWDVVALDADAAPVPFDLAEGADTLEVTSAPLRVTVARADGRVTVADLDGRLFASDLAPPSWREVTEADAEGDAAVLQAIAGLDRAEGVDADLARRARTRARMTKGMAPDEAYYGFGARIGLLDRRGRTLTNWTVDPHAGHGRGLDNMYQAHPTFLAVRPGLAWGLFLHSTWLSRFDAGAARPDELAVTTLGGELDYYLLYGPTPAGVVEKLTRLTGRPALPPLWALGYHQSRWGYDTAGEARAVAQGFRERDIPLDVLHLDIDYMRGYRDFTWDPARFPDPAGLVADLRALGARAVTIVDPGVKDDVGNGYPVADDGVARDAFIKNPDGSLFVGYCWPDAALFPDFARAETRAWWGEQHGGHVAAGVAGIWNDMNEPAIFSRPFSEGPSDQQPMPPGTPQGAGDEQTVHAEARNLYALLMDRATAEGLRALRPDTRPWILTRSGYTGLQRYAAAWMGDNNSWWEHLEASLPQLMSMGLCGVPHVGVDIGGFFENCAAELYARWVQLGTFYPFMRTHTATDTGRQEPWSFGLRVEGIARAAIKLRYRLLPYLYTLAHEAARTGAPILRPLVYDFPDDGATRHLDDQAMVGPHLLVAPILRPGRDYRAVYLPAGRWYDYWTGRPLEGGRPVMTDAPLERIPLYVRGGAILPLGDERPSTATPLAELTLEVYPAGDDAESAWTLVEDDGETFAYERGEVAETTVRVSADGGRVAVTIGERAGPFRPQPRTVRLRVHTGWRPASVTTDGAAGMGWAWREEEGAAELAWADAGRARRVECAR